VVILPTSTSFGADALIVPNSVTDIKQLRGKIHGLAKSVSNIASTETSNSSAKPNGLQVQQHGSGAPLSPCNKNKGNEAIVV
jgi:hypothetical protein